MDAWSSIILVVNVLLLVAGWLLFQQAKSDLTARAAQIPVLSEVKALQKSIAALLEQLKLESGQASAHLEARCLEARDLLVALDRKLEAVGDVKPRAKGTRSRAVSPEPEPAVPPSQVDNARARTASVVELAESGMAPAAIAQQVGCSVGEVDLILGLRDSIA